MVNKLFSNWRRINLKQRCLFRIFGISKSYSCNYCLHLQREDDVPNTFAYRELLVTMVTLYYVDE